ncbi:MAG: SLBB domain-containing protein [Bacteroidetes bacterium]|nr:SLBB domain-containing protein [Bacteroidota bacterium]
MGFLQNIRLRAITAIVSLAVPLLVLGQTDPFNPPAPPQADNSNYSNAAAFVFSSGEGINIEVGLWGHIGKPGLYRVPHTTDLVSLISLAGGPQESARLNEIRILRVVRNTPEAEGEQRILIVDLETFIETGRREDIPILQPGDVIVISGSIYMVFKDFLGIVRDMALILNTIYLIDRISKE